MSTAIPNNLRRLTPAVETIPTGGPIFLYDDGVALAAVVQSRWLDIAAWGDIRIQGLVNAGFGTLVVEWSMDDGNHVNFTTAPPLLPLAAGISYDSGAIVPLAQYMRVTYTQGGALAPALYLVILAAEGVGGGGIGPVVVNVNLQGYVETLLAPDPAATRSALAALALLEEPDGALRTRARVLTDEGEFYDDFGAVSYPAATILRPIAGTVTLAAASTAWSRSSAATPLRVGDYIKADADPDTSLRQIWTITAGSGGLAGTLRTVYAGAGGAGVAGSLANFEPHIVDSLAVGSSVQHVGSTLILDQLGLQDGDVVEIARGLGGSGLKTFVPFRVFVILTLDQRRANQRTAVGLLDAATIAAAMNGAFIDLVGALAATQVQCTTFNEGAATSETETLPGGAHTDNVTVLALDVYPDRVAFRFYDHSGQTTVLNSSLYRLPDPYRPLYLYAGVINSGGVVAGKTVLTLDVLAIQNLDLAVVESTQLDATRLQMTPARTPYAAETSVAAAAVDTSLLASNERRVGFEIRNDSDKLMYLSFGTAATTAATTRINPGASYYDEYRWTGTVRAIWEAGVVGNARVRELTA